MTTAEGQAAIEAALADFGAKRGSQTQLSPNDEYDVNADLTTVLLTALDTAWSD